MARISTSGLLGNITGSIAGTTFQNSVSGQIARKKPTQLKSYNQRQGKVRLINTQLNNLWATMTDQERQQWDIMVNAKFKTGKQAFYHSNFYLFWYGKSPIITPSLKPSPVGITTTNIIYNLGDLSVLTDFSADTNEYILCIKISQPYGTTINRARNNLRLLDLDVTDTGSFFITPAYHEQFGFYPQVGQVIFIALALFDLQDGVSSPFITKRIIVEPVI
jgi:hypothetical protein